MPLNQITSPTFIGIIAGFFSALSFACMALLVQRVSADIPIQEISFTRGLFAFVILLPLNFSSLKKAFTISAKYIWFRSFAGASAVICYFWNTTNGSAAEAKALSNVSPLFVAIFSYAIFKERLNRQELMGLIVLLIGAVLLIFHLQAKQSSLVYIIGLLGSVFAGMAYLSLKQASAHFSKGLIVLVFSFCVMLVSFVVPSKTWIMPHGPDILFLLGVGFFGLIGQLFLTLSHVKLKNALASSLTLLTLLFLVIYELIFSGKAIPEQTLLSYLLISIGMLVMSWHRKKS